MRLVRYLMALLCLASLPALADVQFGTDQFYVRQDGGSITIPVSLTNRDSATQSVTVNYRTVNASAVAGTDYTVSTGTLVWQTSDFADKTFTVPILDSGVAGPDTAFRVELYTASGSVVGSIASATVNIINSTTASPGTISFQYGQISAPKQNSTVMVTAIRRAGTKGAISATISAVGGTARNLVDYSFSPTAVSWADGEIGVKSVPVTIYNASSSGNQSIVFGLSGASGGASLSTANETLTLVDVSAASPGVLGFQAASQIVNENAGTVTINVVRSVGANGPASVSYYTTDGTADSRAYTPVTGTLNWAAGESGQKSLTVPILQKGYASGDLTFSVNLQNAYNAALDPNASTTLVTIKNTDVATSSLALDQSSYSVNSGSGSVRVGVVRTGPGSAAASVTLATSDGTAVAGTDYTATTTTLNWAINDVATKYVNIPVVPASSSTPNKTFVVSLSSPSGGDALATPSNSVVTIVNQSSSTATQFRFNVSAITTGTQDGVVLLQVERTNSAVGAVSVQFSTADGSAHAGADYTPSTGTLTWNDGDNSSRTLSIPITNTGSASTTNFLVRLFGNSAGTTLGSPNVATVTIVPGITNGLAVMSLAQMATEVYDDAGSLVITLVRTGNSAGAISVNVATIDGSAIAGTDYTAIPADTIVSWADGDTAPKQIVVPIRAVSQTAVANKTFSVQLSQPTGASALGTSLETVTIRSRAAQVDQSVGGGCTLGHGEGFLFYAMLIFALLHVAFGRRRRRTA